MRKTAFSAVLFSFLLSAAMGAGDQRLTLQKAEQIIKKEAARKGDGQRAMQVLWVHNGQDDALIRVKDQGRLLLMKLVKDGKRWRVDAVESRTGVWMKTGPVRKRPE